MKKLIKKLLVTGCITGAVATTTFAQPGNPVITVDESGNGTYVFGNVTNTLFSTIGTDAISGLTSLIYVLPFIPVAGDIILTDATGVGSDVLRFGGSNKMFFFSDVAPGDLADSPADSGLPTIFLTNNVTFLEQGPEAGPNGYFGYNPGFTGPGGNSAGAIFNFISDPAPIPEPGSLALLAGGLGIFGLRFWRRR
jgi:hypothetical protein